MKAVVYIRTSTKEQHPENQLPSIESYCQTHGIQIVAVCQETESAFKSGRQVELQKIIESSRERTFDLLIIWSLDRLSRRGIAHILNLIQIFKTYGVKVISMQETWLETDGPMQELLLAVFGWAAAYESRIKSERTLAGLERAKAEGKKLGRPAGKKDSVKRNRRGYLLRYARAAKKRSPFIKANSGESLRVESVTK